MYIRTCSVIVGEHDIHVHVVKGGFWVMYAFSPSVCVLLYFFAQVHVYTYNIILLMMIMYI